MFKQVNIASGKIIPRKMSCPQLLVVFFDFSGLTVVGVIILILSIIILLLIFRRIIGQSDQRDQDD